MRINRINDIFNIKQNPITKQTPAITIPNDCFVKSKEVAFNGNSVNPNRQEQIKKFENGVRKTFLEGPFSLERIQQAVDESIQGVKVKSFEECPPEIPISKEWMGVFVMPLGINPEENRLIHNLKIT